MARFPIYRTNQSLPGRSGQTQASLNVDTGAGMVASAAGQFSGAVSNMASVTHRLQAESELVNANAENQRLVDEMLLKLKTVDDPDEYAAIFNETFSEIESRQLSNGLARRKYANAMPGYRASLQGVVQSAAHDRAIDNYTNALATERVNAIQGGSLKGFTRLLSTGVSQGLMSGRAATRELTETRHAVSQQQMTTLAAADPEKVLGWKDVPDMQKEFRFALPTDLEWIRGLAKSAVNTRKVQNLEAQRQSTMGLWSYLLKPDSTAKGAFDMIRAIPDDVVDPDQKLELMAQVNERTATLAKGQPDPLKVRQDYGAYRDLLLNTVDGQAQEKDWRDALGSGKISLSDYQQGAKIIADQQDARGDANSFANVVKTMNGLIDKSMLFLVDKEASEAVQIRAFQALDDRVRAAKEAGRPLAGRDLMTEAIRIAYEMEDAYERSGSAREFLTSAPGSAPRTPMPESPEPKTMEEFVAEVKRINAVNPAAAKSYYDRWKAKWQ